MASSENPADTEANFGLVHNPYTAGSNPVFAPKPSYFAAQTFLTTLGDYEFAGVSAVPGSTGTSLFTFERGRSRRYAVYTTSSTPEPVMLLVPPGNYEILDLSGNVVGNVTAGDSGRSLTATGDTQFLIRR